MILTDKIPRTSDRKPFSISVEKWCQELVMADPKATTQFKDCYEDYQQYAIKSMRAAPCSKKTFGVAFRDTLRELLDKGIVIESRTGGLCFKGIRLVSLSNPKTLS